MVLNSGRVIFGFAFSHIPNCLPSDPSHGGSLPLFLLLKYSKMTTLNSVWRASSCSVFVGGLACFFFRAFFFASELRLRGFGEGDVSSSTVSCLVTTVSTGTTLSIFLDP